jgi:transcription elongation factor
MRSLILAAAAALALGGMAGAATPGYANGPYTLDANGNCRDASGTAVDQTLCPAKPKTTGCHDAVSGKAEPCDVQGAVRDQP